MSQKLFVHLCEEDRATLEKMTRSGMDKAREIARARPHPAAGGVELSGVEDAGADRSRPICSCGWSRSVAGAVFA